jgi:hypothetical protein
LHAHHTCTCLPSLALGLLPPLLLLAPLSLLRFAGGNAGLVGLLALCIHLLVAPRQRERLTLLFAQELGLRVHAPRAGLNVLMASTLM